MEKTTKLQHKIAKCVLNFLSYSGDTPEKVKERVELTNKKEKIAKEKQHHNKKHGSNIQLALSYLAFFLPFSYLVITHYYLVKRGDVDAGAAMLLMTFGLYVFFISFITKKNLPLIDVIVKVHYAFVMVFIGYMLNILVRVSYFRIGGEDIAAIVITVVIGGGLKVLTKKLSSTDKVTGFTRAR